MPARVTRSVAGTALLALALVISACGGASDTSAESTPTPTPQPTATGSATDAVAWADGVCTATDDLQGSIDAIGSSLQVDITGGGDALTQLRDQLGEQVQGVQDDASALASAIADVPAGGDEQLAAARDDLEASRAALQTSVQTLTSSIQDLTQASGAAELSTGVAAVTAAYVGARADAGAFATSLQAVASAGGDTVQGAFEDAPSCAARTSGS
jgi:hypothetical protein